jgi:hypothetical protein
MAALVEESLDFVASNLVEIILLPIDMNCLSSTLVKRLAQKVDLEYLEHMKDKRDKLKSKLYMKKLELVFDKQENLLYRCVSCNQLCTKAQREWQQCPAGQNYVEERGSLQSNHIIDKSWELNKFVMSLRAAKIPWKDIFWKFFACMLEFKCSTCGDRFTGNKMNQCNYHPEPPLFLTGQNQGYYTCCNHAAERFKTEQTFGKEKDPGCTLKKHTLRPLQPESEGGAPSKASQKRRKVSRV